MPGSPPKITLDTNIFINLFDRDSRTATSVDILAAIIRYGLSGQADIAATTRVEADLENDTDHERRERMRGYLDILPLVGTEFRLDVSKLSGGDMLSDAESSALHTEIQRIVFPGLSPEHRRYRNRLYDIDHLVGHKLAGRDIFVTDDRDIWRRREQLYTGPGIIVMVPQDCLSHIDQVSARSKPQKFETSGISKEYYSPKLIGSVRFDYSNNNQRFSLGDGQSYFETQWSKASDRQIYALNDPPSISGLALAKGLQEIAQIADAASLDFSSRHRMPSIGQIIVWRNINGIYAATKIISIKDDTRGSEQDELKFDYVILADGSRDFSAHIDKP